MFQFSPFNDFQGLTGCLKNGVHSKDDEPDEDEDGAGAAEEDAE